MPGIGCAQKGTDCHVTSVATLTTSSWRRRSLRTCVCCAGFAMTGRGYVRESRKSQKVSLRGAQRRGNPFRGGIRHQAPGMRGNAESLPGVIARSAATRQSVPFYAARSKRTKETGDADCHDQSADWSRNDRTGHGCGICGPPGRRPLRCWTDAVREMRAAGASAPTVLDGRGTGDAGRRSSAPAAPPGDGTKPRQTGDS